MLQHTDLLRQRLLAADADHIAICFEPVQVLEQLVGSCAVLMRQIVKTDQQPHLGLSQETLPTRGAPSLGLLSPATPRRHSGPGSCRVVMGLAGMV